MSEIAFWSLVIGSLFWWFGVSLLPDDVVKVIAAVFGSCFFAIALFCMGALAWMAL